MTRILPMMMVLGLGLGLACDSKTEEAKSDKKAETKKADDKKADDKKADAKGEPAKAEPAADAKAEPAADAKAEPAADAKPAVAELEEIDLSPWGDAFKGYVAMAPKGTKVEFDDPSRQLIISDVDFVSMGEAPGYADAIKSLASDKDNSNINVVSETEARWERNPPLGKQWNFDIKLDIGGKPWSCNGGTFTDAAMGDALVNVCKSIKKK
ncbi:MAG: hypothetical protein IPH07_32495 [Deltaproteobacteria bacterium]|nr:hypothetical protein [Deltaproteobacteria bacterium]MBK8719777.1 hypothetical protein [Deltaproteobacteria bacterium]MBP7285247.1 hypothetical protein [Nannocystaceae bacterium]